MKQVNITRENIPLNISITADWCDSFLCKLRGLTFRKSLPENMGLVLVGKQDSKADASIHMLFVFFDLAIVWINDAGTVVDIKLAKSWWSILVPEKPARYVLEVHPNQLDQFSIGDQLVFQEISVD